MASGGCKAQYRDATPDERGFQKDLLVRLDQQDALHDQVQEGSEVGGGETDLVHDGIVAELKVEKTPRHAGERRPVARPDDELLVRAWVTARNRGRPRRLEEDAPSRAPGELRPLARAQAAWDHRSHLPLARCCERLNCVPVGFAGDRRSLQEQREPRRRARRARIGVGRGLGRWWRGSWEAAVCVTPRHGLEVFVVLPVARDPGESSRVRSG